MSSPFDKNNIGINLPFVKCTRLISSLAFRLNHPKKDPGRISGRGHEEGILRVFQDLFDQHHFLDDLVGLSRSAGFIHALCNHTIEIDSRGNVTAVELNLLGTIIHRLMIQ